MARKRGDIGWLVLGVAVVVFEVLSDDLLSDSFARFKSRHRVLAYLLLFIVPAHLSERLPSYADPIRMLNGVRLVARHGVLSLLALCTAAWIKYNGKRDPVGVA